MCGINTIFRKDAKPVDSADISRMCAAIEHRGPDGAGFAMFENRKLALGHVRLSIIDLHSGEQPLYNEDGSVCIVFNGEIYDYKNLREGLLERGHIFRTQTDTEVIVHLYEEYGMDFINHLNGEFAFIIWDGRKKKLIAARDRCGVKPLFWYESGEEILLSSEIKGILSVERVPRAISPDYLSGAMFGAFTFASSAIEGIKAVKPGHFLVIEQGKTPVEQPYWEMKFPVQQKMTFKEARDQVRDLFTKAVRRRMVADVPVGTYLSGGLDSTLVCGLMSELNVNLKAFSMGLGDKIYDESGLARKIAEHFGAEFEPIDCNDEVLAEDLFKTVYHVEKPLVNANSIARQRLSSFVHSKGYKVCVTGEGADEVFGGYAYFKMEKLWRMMLAGGESAKEADELWKQFVKLESRSEGLLWERGNFWRKAEAVYGDPLYHHARVAKNGWVRNRVLHPDVKARSRLQSPVEYFMEDLPPEKLKPLDPFNRTKMVTFHQLTGLLIPTQGDRVEMANSVECRTPFLDKDLVDFVGTVPPEHLMDIKKLREKHLLREAFKDKLPLVMANTHKHPFLTPSWRTISKTKQGQAFWNEFMTSERIKAYGLFNPNSIRRLKIMWAVLPKSMLLWRRLDTLLGMIWSTQILHHQMVERGVQVDLSKFKIEDRTWKAPARYSEPVASV